MMILVSTEEEEKHAKSEAEMQAKTMQLNVVRLCFQAYLQDNQGQIIQVLPSQISNPIFDSSKSVLVIGPVHEISINVVCATSKGSDQPAHTRSLIRAFDSLMNIL